MFPKKTQESIRRVAAKHGIELVLAFGSAVSGAMHAGSDVDIAVLLPEGREERLSLLELSGIIGDLQELFPDFEVDLVILNHADPLLLKKVMENAGLIYGEPRRLSELKMYAYKRYLDHKPYLEMERRFAVEYPKHLERAAG